MDDDIIFQILSQQNEEDEEDNKTNKKEQNLKQEEEEDKFPEIFPKFVNPLDEVKFIEFERINLDISYAKNNFFMEKQKKIDPKYDISIINCFDENLNNNTSFVAIKNKTFIFYDKNGNVLELSDKEKKLIINIFQKDIENLDISCIDITDDAQEIILGFQEGTIIVINRQQKVITFKNNKIEIGNSCIELKIFKRDKDRNTLSFISSWSNGLVYYIILKKTQENEFYTINSSNIILKNDSPIFMIKNILDFNLNENYSLLGSFEEISLFSIESNIKMLFSIKKPKESNNDAVPDAQIGLGNLLIEKNNQDKNIILIISWGNKIYFYQIEVSNSNCFTYYYNQIGIYQGQNNILRIGFIKESIIYFIDDTL